MLNTETVLDQDQDPDQGPVLVILVPQDTIMVTTFTTMTIGEGSIHTFMLPSLVQNGNDNRPLLNPHLLQLNIKN